MDAHLLPQLEELARDAHERGASDLFLVPGEPPAVRLHGQIERLQADVLLANEVRDMAAAIIGNDNLARIGPELGRFQRWCALPGECSLSACVARARGDITLVLRILPEKIYSLAEMHFPEAMGNAALAPSGLIVVAGPMGSGKTTGLIGLVDHINANLDGCHICTVEGPSHVTITPKKALVQQREVGVDVPSILAGIQAAQDQDLDVLLVGEITTVEELQACITTAEMGHMVLTQLHAQTPEEAIRRMIEVFPDEIRPVSRRALAGVLRGVSAQRLVPAANGSGRLAVYGVLIPDKEMRQALADGRDFMERKTAWPAGCQAMAEHVERLRAEGAISDEAADQALAEM